MIHKQANRICDLPIVYTSSNRLWFCCAGLTSISLSAAKVLPLSLLAACVYKMYTLCVPDDVLIPFFKQTFCFSRRLCFYSVYSLSFTLIANEEKNVWTFFSIQYIGILFSNFLVFFFVFFLVIFF